MVVMNIIIIYYYYLDLPVIFSICYYYLTARGRNCPCSLSGGTTITEYRYEIPNCLNISIP